MTAAFADLSSMEVGSELVDPIEQKREEWFRQRAGKFTCSRFGELMATGRKKDEEFSQTGWNYIYQVAAERLGSFTFEFDNAPVRWGKENEHDAIQAYINQTNALAVATGTSCYRQLNDFIGGTPDGLVGEDGCIEVKCPYSPQEHMRYVHGNTVPAKYYWQVHGHMLVTGRRWCDFVSFDPRMEGEKRLLIVRAERDEELMKMLVEKLHLAFEKVQEIIG